MNNTNCSIKPIVFIFIGGYLPAKKQGGPVTSIRNFVEHFSSKYEIRIDLILHLYDIFFRIKRIPE